jgi:sulfur relay protein TusB/DsrH
MKTLIFLNKFNLNLFPLAETLREKQEEVSVILIQDAIYLGLKNGEHSEATKHAIEKGVKFHLLTKDVERRGVIHHLISDLELIDYDRLIDLLFREDQRVFNL